MAEIDLRYTSDQQERHRRVRLAILILLLMFDEHSKPTLPSVKLYKGKGKK